MPYLTKLYEKSKIFFYLKQTEEIRFSGIDY